MILLPLCGMSESTVLRAQQPSPISLADLPKPSPAVGDLIESGRVTFETGHRDESVATGSGTRLAAETRFRINFNYASQSRWTLASDGRRLVIDVRYARITWKPKHTVWFRQRPATKSFWTNKLVLHELDHVRISSDPRLATRFAESLREQGVLVHPLSGREVVNQRLVDRLVREHVERVFAEMTELISIRYRELDRVTKHGRLPLGGDSPVQQWLSLDRAVSP